MKAALIIAAGLCLLPPPARAQTQTAPECAAALETLRTQTNVLLDASIHGEDAFGRASTQDFSPAVSGALKACRDDDRAKRAIYNLQSQLSTYQAARDVAMGILQAHPPTPVN